jgi:quercetin dioxygenase-like cupin family protein
VDGQATRVVKTGEAFIIPANTIHDALNVGTTKGKILATYFVEKGQPVATFVN